MTTDLTTRIPFAFARSGLFRPGNTSPVPLDNELVPASLDYAIELSASGPALRSCHALAWQALVAISLHRLGRLGSFEVMPSEVLRLMGRRGDINTRARRWLHPAHQPEGMREARRDQSSLLEDLCACRVATTTPIHSYVGPLLASVTPQPGGKLIVAFDPGMDAFVQNEYVAVPLSQKNHLGDHPLAHWLHDYIATHRDTYVASVEAIHRMCGSNLSLSTFRSRLNEALGTLAASPACLSSYTIEGDKITLRKHKTTVVRLTQPKLVASRTSGSRHHQATDLARHQRSRVAL